MMSCRWLLVVLLLIASGCQPDLTSTVYVVRHAETKELKNADGTPHKDPELTDLGKARAEALVQQMENVPLTHIYSSPLKRTVDTVSPVAKAHDLKVATLDGENIEGLNALVRRVNGGAVLVSGHSNTVPQLIAQLIPNASITLAHDDYGDLFVLHPEGSGVRLEQRRFDASGGQGPTEPPP